MSYLINENYTQKKFLLYIFVFCNSKYVDLVLQVFEVYFNKSYFIKFISFYFRESLLEPIKVKSSSLQKTLFPQILLKEKKEDTQTSRHWVRENSAFIELKEIILLLIWRVLEFHQREKFVIIPTNFYFKNCILRNICSQKYILLQI